MNNIKYAVIQIGYATYGIGDTRKNAISEAAKWLTGEDGRQGTTVEQVGKWLSEHENSKFHGDIDIITNDNDVWDTYVDNDALSFFTNH